MINRQWKRKEAKDRPLPLICSRKQIRHDHLAYGQLSEWGNSAHTPNKSDWRRSHNHRDGDCKSAPFLAFGLVPSYGTFFLFLKQIALSSAAYARTLLRGFSRMSRRENGVRNSLKRLFGPQLDAFMAVGILPKYFRGKLLHFEWRQYRI